MTPRRIGPSTPVAPASRLERARAAARASQAIGRAAGGGGLQGMGALTGSLGLLLLSVYLVTIYHSGPLVALAVVALLAAFIGTLIVLEIGLGVLILSMLLSPELTVGELGLRSVTLRLEDIVIPVVALAWLGRKALGLEKRELRHDPILVFMLMFVAIQVLSSYLGTGGGLSLTTSLFYILKVVEYFAIFYFAFQYVNSERRIGVVFALAGLTAAVVSIYNVFLIPSNQIWTLHRISAPFETTPEPSSIGGYFVLMMALLLALALEAPSRNLRRGLYALFALIFVPFLYTLSRTSYAAFLVMAVLLAWLARSRALFIVIALSLVLSPILLPSSVIDRVLYTFQNPHRVLGYFDSSFGERIFIWKKVWWNLRSYPLLGQGVTSHNVLDSYYARVLIETGLVGLLSFILIIGRLFVIARRVRSQHPAWWARAIALGYTAGLVALLVHAFSAITFVIVRIMEPFWLVSGILAGLASAPGGDDAEATPSPPTPDVPRRNRHHG